MEGAKLIHKKIASLFNNSDHSDLTLVASDSTTYHAHLNILSRFTDFFTKAVSTDSKFSESTTKTVEFPEHTPSSLKAFIEFCYNGNYTSTTAEVKISAQLDVEVYLLADYLAADDLKGFAARKLKGHINHSPAGELSKEKFKVFWSSGLPGIIEDVFSNTTSAKTHQDVRDVVCDTVVKGLLDSAGYPWEPLSDQLKKYGDFGAIVLGKYADELRNGVHSGYIRRSDTCSCGYEVVVSKPGTSGEFNWSYGYLRCPNPACGGNINWKKGN